MSSVQTTGGLSQSNSLLVIARQIIKARKNRGRFAKNLVAFLEVELLKKLTEKGFNALVDLDCREVLSFFDITYHCDEIDVIIRCAELRTGRISRARIEEMKFRWSNKPFSSDLTLPGGIEAGRFANELLMYQNSIRY